uniref:Anaphase-promoting complex subunit 1 n=1 Tax=Echinostoma caproni TaxID=27848 RepID=A0A183AQE7_9TREM
LNYTRTTINVEQAEDLLDEPLLPKVCLKLVWTEPPPVDFQPKRVRCNSAVGRETPPGSGKFDLISGSTPTNTTLQSPGSLRDLTELSLMSRFRISNRRLMDVGHSTDPFPVSPLVTREEVPRIMRTVDLPEVAQSGVSTMKEEQHGANGMPESGSVRRKGFLALDFVSVPWICFLTSFGAPKTNRPSCLACLRVRGRRNGSNETEAQVDEKSLITPSERLTFLPAVDAVYVEDSRLIACLDPPTGIVLYSGIYRVCLLGASPPPVTSLFCAIAGNEFIEKRIRSIASRSSSMPFVIQPGMSELARWRDNATPALLNEFELLLTRFLDQERSNGKCAQVRLFSSLIEALDKKTRFSEALFEFHRELSLNCILASSLRSLAELNLVLSRFNEIMSKNRPHRYQTIALPHGLRIQLGLKMGAIDIPSLYLGMATGSRVDLTLLLDGVSGVDLKKFMDHRLPPLPKAFVQCMLTLSEMRIREETRVLANTSMTVTDQSHSIQQAAESQHAALLFLSYLGETSLLCVRGGLTNHLRSLPRCFSTVLRILLSRCQANPPPNCTPRMYNLMGRSDLARQAEMTATTRSSRHSGTAQIPRGPLFQQPLLSDKNTTQDDTNMLTCGTVNRPGPQDYSSSWTTAERWANLVKPFRPAPSNEKPKTSLNGRHALLRCLESSPACQVAFKDDLRLREAYRLLQATSHIRLPRLSTDGTGSGSSPTGASSSGTEGSRFNEPRLEMHLAAAGIRVWASAIGRGMLGLDSLIGFRIPTQLRVPPICLRGRAVSPSSGRRVLVDLARESISTLTSGNTAQGPTGTGLPDVALDLGDRRVGTGLPGLIPSGPEVVTSSTSDELNDASNHPGNSMALAIASAVAASGAGAALRTAALNLPRMIPRSNLVMSYSSIHLSSLSANAASSTASLLATANLQQTPAVLAAKHWPDFHNGVAVGLSVSPHASVDATWIMYNCRLAGASSDARPDIHGQLNTAAPDMPTPEQAGLVYGLGLNGHLNKMTPYDIGEYLVRVHDLHNMAVLLGLCAGKRGTMDQSVLRLLAVHYRPLLPSDPLVHLQLSVPSLCQAAAVFGLGLLYQGSAHRHITNLLITELGRSLSGDASTGPGGANRKGGLFAPDGDAQQSVTNAPRTNSTNPTTGWTGAAGTGGFAGDSCELIALSAGLALGLVLLQRGDTSCGLSDLAWAEKLHAYMLGSAREVDAPRSARSRYAGVPQNFDEEYPLLVSLRGQLQSRRGHTAQLRPGPIAGPLSPSAEEPLLIDRYGRSDTSYRLFDAASGLPDLAVLMDDVFPGDFPLGLEDRSGADSLRTSGLVRGRGVPQSYSGGMRTGRVTVGGITPASAGGTTGTTSSTASGADRPNSDANDFARRERRARSHLDAYQSSYKNPQIRELDCYNTDVSAPGAIMALGMAYLGTANSTISQWLSPPSSLAQIELIRPDLFLFRALAHALVNWDAINPSLEWIQSFCPPALLERMQNLTESAVDDFLEDLAQPPSMTELSSEDDVENRCPNPIMAAAASVRQTLQRNTTVGRGRTPARQVSVNSANARRRRRRCQPIIPPFSSTDASRSKLAREFANWQGQFLPDSVSKVDEEAISFNVNLGEIERI